MLHVRFAAAGGHLGRRPELERAIGECYKVGSADVDSLAGIEVEIANWNKNPHIIG